jgi:hypothetical protein
MHDTQNGHVGQMIVVTDISHVRHAPSVNNGLHHRVVVAVSPLAAIEMAWRGEPVMLASSMIRPDEVLGIDDKAYELSRYWLDHIRSWLTVDGLDLVELIALDNLMFFKQVLASDLLCRRLLACFTPREVVCFGPINRPCVDGAAFKDEHDVFTAILVHQCAQMKISCNVLTAPIPASSPPPASTTHHQDRHCPRKIHLNELPCPGGRKRAIAFSNGWGLLRFLPSLEELERTGRYQTIPVNLASEFMVNTSRTGPDGRGLAYLSCQDWAFAGNTLEQSELSRYLSDLRGQLRRHVYDGELSVMNNPWLSFQADHIFNHWLPTALKWRRIYRAMIEDLQPDLVLTDEHSHFLFRLLAWTAMEMGVTTVTTPHGNMLNYPHYFHFRSNLMLCSGQTIKELMTEKLGYASERVEVVGDPVMVDLPCQKPFERKMVFLPDQRYVNFALCPMDVEDYIDSWRNIFAFAAKRPDVDFLIKPHPSYGYREWLVARIEEQKLSNLRIVEDKRVEDFLAMATLSLMLGRISNAGLTTIVMNVPMLFYDRSSRLPSVGDFLWTPENNILVARRAEDFDTLLTRLLDDPAFRRLIADKQRSVIDRYYSHINRDQGIRLISALDRLLHKCST